MVGDASPQINMDRYDPSPLDEFAGLVKLLTREKPKDLQL